jgi:hypothetical protein
MKKLLSLFLVVILLPGCKKTIDRIREDMVISAMTDGEWKVTSFVRDGTNITADFDAFSFKYYSNKTVDAIVNGTVQQSGTWDGDAEAMTTWANFTPAVHPLSLINGNWKIDRNSWTYVEASQVLNGHTSLMRLDKK